MENISFVQFIDGDCVNAHDGVETEAGLRLPIRICAPAGRPYFNLSMMTDHIGARVLRACEYLHAHGYVGSHICPAIDERHLVERM